MATTADRADDRGDADLALDVGEHRRTGHFAYESGLHGDTWLDLDCLFVDQRRLSTLGAVLAARLAPRRAEVVCGPALGGALLGQWVAYHLAVPFVHVERTAPTSTASVAYRIPDGLADVVHGRRVAIVDDAINAGSATLATVAEVARLGGEATVAASIFLRVPGGPELLRDAGLACEYLVGVTFAVWPPADCPLCRDGVPVVPTA